MNRPGQDPVELTLPAFVAGTLDAGEAGEVAAHIAGCGACRASLEEWQIIRSAAHAAAAANAPTPSRGLLDATFAQIDSAARGPRLADRVAPAALRQPAVRRTLVGVAAALIVVLLAGFTPIGSYARGVFQVMQPSHFTAVPVTLADLQALPALNRYGQYSQNVGGAPQHSADATAAGQASGMRILVPASLPSSVTASPTYTVLPGESASFTFEAAKAQAAAAAQGKAVPPMPVNIDGSSIQLTIGTAVVTIYGGNADMLLHLAGAAGAPASPSAAPGSGSLSAMAEAVPQLVIAQAPAPVAMATGASPTDLENYLLSLPGITPDLAKALRAIGDPTRIWPIPVPVGSVSSHTASVQGVSATVLSDTSGFGAGVMWVKDGILYAVAAPLSEQTILHVANSLH